MTIPARIICLEAGAHEGAVRFLTSLHVRLEEARRQTWVTITRTGEFSDPRYGNFTISRPMLLAMVENFERKTFGQDIFIDVAHRPSDGAAGKILNLSVEGDRLRALVDWTDFGLAAIRERGFVYLSAEYAEDFRDNEKGERHGPVLLGAALTVRPVIKGLDPIRLSEDAGCPTLLHPALQSQLITETKTMWKTLIDALRAKLGTFKLADTVAAQIITLAEAAVGKVTDETAAKALIAAVEDGAKKLAEEIAAAAPGADIKVQLAVPDTFKSGMSKDEVAALIKQLSEDQAKQAKALAETRDARVKLLSDTITAAQGIPDEDKAELVKAVSDLVTADMSEDQVKRLAAVQIDAGNRLVSTRALAAMGYQGPAGTVHISVDSSNEIKTLQEEVDKRLFSRMPAHRRYQLSSGMPIDANKQLVEEALAQYDREHGRRLHEEFKRHKQLASGDSLVSDVSIPAIFERTVIREALYQLVGLGLCDVGTAAFSSVLQLPYSYRDTGATGVSGTRKYEGQAIARAAVKQALEEARPIPQKLAFEVSDELRYLVGNGQIDFDIVAENARNASRIIGEDSEQVMFNEFLNAADQYAVTAVSNENLELQADDTKRVFILAQWPVVRPKKVYDLQGSQVGSTLYPVTVTYNSVALSEYDNTGTQSAGTYYVLNYNLGEIYLVNQAGAIQTPANATAYTISYSYTTNVHKWDSDLGSDEVKVKYNDFLYRFGLRKVAIEDRAYMPNVATMSGTLRTQIEQAEQFGANFKRPGTDLMADGNLGRIKDVPSFRSYAPGLNAGDIRTVLMERGSTRFRLMKGWTMGMLENQKDGNGRYTGKKEAYGDQFIVVHTPTQLKGAFTSMVVYSATARVARVNP